MRCPVINIEQIEQFRFLGVFIALFDIIVGTFGNLFTILAFTRCKALHTPYNVFIVNLSIIGKYIRPLFTLNLKIILKELSLKFPPELKLTKIPKIEIFSIGDHFDSGVFVEISFFAYF